MSEELKAKVKAIFPEDVEGIYISKNDYDRLYGDMTLENIKLKEEIERLNKKIEQYEDPEDMTLMFMWCDEKAKDEIKRLNNIINELEHYLKVEKWKSIGGIHLGVINEVLDKLQRLKGSDKVE